MVEYDVIITCCVVPFYLVYVKYMEMNCEPMLMYVDDS
jgi:hypothetical protein